MRPSWAPDGFTSPGCCGSVHTVLQNGTNNSHANNSLTASQTLCELLPDSRIRYSPHPTLSGISDTHFVLRQIKISALC